ncbi:hypothetical protein VTN00DRAFT_583 [Thermoascus crustaceus]|uniref:uncharacterized protein n=1 Tax=Thermoascus crustaceus TaxID=5088 RepID=UPI00374335C4
MQPIVMLEARSSTTTSYVMEMKRLSCCSLRITKKTLERHANGVHNPQYYCPYPSAISRIGLGSLLYIESPLIHLS